MDLNIVTTAELTRRHQLGWSSAQAAIRCSAFHPSEPQLFVATEDDIFMVDAMQGQIMSRFTVNSGQVVQIFTCAKEPLLGALVALEEEYVLYVWNLQLMAIKSVTTIKHVTPKKPTNWGVTFDAKLFYMQQGTKVIHSLDWKDGSQKKIESPKPLNAMFLHPFKPLLASILSDGTIRVINVITNNATLWNEGASSDKDRPIQVVFHPSQSYMVALMSSGTLLGWDTANPKDPFLGLVKALSAEKENVDHVFFHGTLPLLLTVTNSGAFTAWNFFARKNTWLLKIVDTLGRSELNPAQNELSNRYGHLPNFATKMATEVVALTEVKSHPSYNFLVFNFRFVGKSNAELFHVQHLLGAFRLGIYSLRLFEQQLANVVISQQQSLLFWASPEKEIRIRSQNMTAKPSLSASTNAAPTAGNTSGAAASLTLPARRESAPAHIGLTPRENLSDTKETINVFYFNNESFLLDDLNLLAYSPAYNDLSLAKKLPAVDFEGHLLRPTRLVRSILTDRFLVFFLRQDPAKDMTTFGVSIVARDTATKDITVSPVAGQTGVFFGAEDEFLVLSEDGTQVEIWKNEEDSATLPMVYSLAGPMLGVFATPLENSSILWFLDPQRWRLVASHKNPFSGNKFLLNTQSFLPLQPGELVSQIVWRKADDDPASSVLAAVLTSRRVLIVNEKLQVIASTQAVASSCIWLGAALLFNTNSHLQFLTVRNACHPLISLRLPDAVLVTLLNDRVALAVRRAGETSVVTNAVGLLEPLILGFLHYFDSGLADFDRKQCSQILKDCAESYDARRVSWQLVEEVTKHGYREFALQLLLANPHILSGHHQFAFELALSTHHYSTAFILVERSSVLKTPSNLFRLQRAALKLGQFDVARKCAECTSDYATLLYLYTLTRNKEGLLVLKKELERDKDTNAGTLALLQRQLQRPEIASQPSTKPETTTGTGIAPLVTSEAQKIFAHQDSGMLPKLGSRLFAYTPTPVLNNMTYVMPKRWKVEPHAQMPCEMKTLPLEGAGGNLVVGALLLNTLLGDWFTRQVPYFELPEALRGDAAQREVILKLLADKQADMADRNKKRTQTIGGGAPPPSSATSVPSLTLTGLSTSASKPAATLTARGTSGLPVPPAASAAAPGDATKSPRKIGSQTGMRPMTTAAANLINAIANSGGPSKDREAGTSKSAGTPPNLLGSEESSSPTDSEGRAALAAAAHSSSADISSTQILALAEQALTTDPIVLFTSSLSKLERADYDGCLLDLNAVLLSLLANNVQSASTAHLAPLIRQQVEACVRYKLVCMLLLQIRKLEEQGTKSVEVARLAQFLADVPVLPRHRLVLLRLALKKSLIVQNYGFAAKCLHLLLLKELPDKAALQKQLDDCKAKDLRDAEPLSLGTRLCVKSFAASFIAPTRSCVICQLCHASYHRNLISLAAPCHYCFWRGTLQEVKSIEKPNQASTSTVSAAVTVSPGIAPVAASGASPTSRLGVLIAKELNP